jgi:hypothetical protein
MTNHHRKPVRIINGQVRRFTYQHKPHEKQQAKTLPPGTRAARFLKRLYPKGPWLVTSINPRNERTRTYCVDNFEETRLIICRCNRFSRNNAYTINEVTRPMQSKPGKDDIRRVHYLHVDADPGPDETPQTFKQRMLPMLEQFEPKPTVIVDSGNGLQALWLLKEPVELTNPQVTADIEARNYALALAFGADPVTRNVDRLFRLPGTVNYPDATKLKKGRVERRAKLLTFEESRSYGLAQFVAHEPPQEPAIENEGNTNQLPAKLATLLHVKGAGGYPSRHELVWAFLCGAIRAKVADKIIIDACLDPAFAGNGIYDHINEQGGQECAARQLQRAHEAVAKEQTKGKVNPGGDEEKRPLIARRMDQFERKELQWLWYPFIPLHMLTLLIGDKAIGKSSVAIDAASRVTNGALWPAFGEDPAERAPKGSVIILCKENDIARIIRPRLEAAGADLSRVHTLGYEVADDPEALEPLKQLKTTTKDLEQRIKEIGDVKLIVIDPITDYVGDIDTHRDGQVRRLLNPLGRLAARYDLAILYILHVNKKTDLPTRYRGLGSVAFRNVSQSTLVTAKDPDDPGQRYLCQDAANLCPETRSVSFRMKTVRAYHKIEWGTEWEDVDVDQIMDDKPTPKKERAQKLLRESLSKGPVTVKELKTLAQQHGISWRTMNNAKVALGIESDKPEGVEDAGWKWELKTK